MADVNANIGVHIDTSAALAELKNLQRQLATFHGSIAKGSAASAMAQKNLQTNLLNSINSTGKFTAQMGLVRTSTESFTHALEKNKLGMREYFRYAGGATKTFGRLFKQEFDTINKVSEDRVKKMQTQYIKMGRDANGALRAIAIKPLALDMDNLATKTAMAAQKQALFNQLVKQGSTNLLNFGKNTQWAGRQLMVGFTVPLAYFGTAASKVFMDLEAQAIKFKRVYGDMFTTTDQTNKALEDVRKLAEEFTKYGVAVSKTMEMAASAAAMGKTGADLTAQVAQATRLAVLGNVEQEQALETTVSLTNAFGIAAEDLASKINFLNSVENQTVVSIEDLTVAIPKAGPVVKQLGGDVEDLAFFLTAMKEGGINASEGANALKSGLASLINPSKKASEMLAGLGVNIKGIVEANKGDLKNTVIGFAQALDTLAPLDRSRAIEQLFGKFQFARLSTLFQNITKDGTQASRVLQLAGASVEELAILSERELKTVEDAVGTNFKESMEKLKLAIAPIGEIFLKTITPVVKTIGNLLDKFNDLGDGTKKFIVVASTLVGIIGPTLLMTFGLLANGAANIIKLFLSLRMGFLKAGSTSKVLAQQTSYMNSEQLEAATVAASLNQAHTRLTQSFTAETSAVRALRQAYIDATIAAANFARSNPGMMIPGKGKTPKKFGRGTRSVPGTGNKDNVPAVLTPGEAVLPTRVSQDPKYQPIIDAMLNGTLQTYGTGTGDAQPFSNSPKFVPKTYLPPKIVSTDPSQVNDLVSGKGRQQVSPAEWEARRLKALAQVQARRSGAAIVGETGIQFDGALYNAKSARGAKGVKDFIDGLVKNADGTFTYIDEKTKQATTISRKRLHEVLSYRSQSGKNLTTSDIKRSLDIGSGARGSGRGTSRPPWIAKLMSEAKGSPNVLAEETAVKEALAKKGVTKLTQDQQKNLFGLQASHIVEERNPQGIKEWRAANLVPEPGYINNYINTVKGKLSQELLAMTDDQLKSLNIDRSELKRIASGNHPTTANAANTLRSVAQYQIGKNPNAAGIYQAEAVVAGINYRMQNNTYKGGLKTLAQLFPTNKKVMQEIAVAKGETLETKDGKVKKVTGQTGKPKPSGTRTKSPRDTRVISTKGVARIVPAGKGFRVMPGAVDGVDLTGQSVGSKMSDVQKQFRSEQNSLRRQIEKVEKRRIATLKAEEKQLKSQSQTRKENIKAVEQNTAQTISAKEKVAAFSGKAGVAVGAMSGLTIAASFAGGKLGEMAQKIMPFVFGLQGFLALMPMLMNPWVALIAVITSLVVGAKLIDSNNKKMAQKQSDYIDSVSATTDKMKKVGEITGKIGASELMARRRQDSSPDAFSKKYNRAGQQFGTNFMGSEIGKEISKGFSDSLLNNRPGAVKQFALQLSGYVSDGVIDGVQAGDIARQIAVDFQDMTLYPAIIGELTNLIGPDGVNLLIDPLKIRVKIIAQQSDIAKISADQIVPTPNDNVVERYQTLLNPKRAFNFIKEFTAGNKLVKETAAATAAAYSQSFELAKAQVDATNAQYQKDLQLLETKKNIAKTEKDRIAAQIEIDTLTSKNKKDNIVLGKELASILVKQEKAFDRTSRKSQKLTVGERNFAQEAFIESSKQQVRSKFKGSKLESQVPAFLENTKNLASKDLEVKINAIAASGTNPMLLTGLMNMFKGDEKTLNKQIDLGIATRGIDETASLVGSLAIIEDKKLQKELFIKINAVQDKGKFGDLQSTLTKISEMAGKDFDVNTYFKVNGFEKLQKLSSTLRTIQNVPDPITKTTQLENLGLAPEEFAGIVDNWEYFMSLPETIRKNAITTYVTAYEMVGKDEVAAETNKRIGSAKGRSAAALKKYYASPKGQAEIKADLAAAATKPQYSPSQPKPKTPVPGSADAGTKKDRDTTLDSLLKQLKLTRDASINAEGGLQELRKVFKKAGGDIAIFKGLNQALSKLGADSGFIDFIGGMDNATEKGYVNAAKLKKGIVELTDDGKLALKGYQEAMLGAFSSSSAQAINELQKQRSGFVALKASGLGSADALEMISDANFAVSLSAAKTSEEVKKLIEQFRLQRKEADLTLAANDPQGYFNDQMTLANKAYDVQERMARRQYEPQIEAYDKLIQANNELIQEKQRLLEVNNKYGTRTIDLINEEIDALNRSMEVGVDKQLQALQDESTRLSEDQAIIGNAVDAINAKYDLQEEALNKISDINQEIINQQKSQLSLADALTQGDISAAAQLAQDMRAESAAVSSKRAGDIINAARNAEIAGVVGPSGLTSQQISERQYQIDRQSYTLSQQRAQIETKIAAKQEELYQIDLLRKPIVAEITALEDKNYNYLNNEIPLLESKLKKELDFIDSQRQKWEDAQLAIDFANIKTQEFSDKLTFAETLLGKVSSLWNSLTSKNLTVSIQKIEETIQATAGATVKATTAAAADAIFDAARKANTNPSETYRDYGAGVSIQAPSNLDKNNSQAVLDAAINSIKSGSASGPRGKLGQILGMGALSAGGMVPKYFASGGFSRGTDTVPAMLTPGEFVVKKFAVDKFGLNNLKSINNGTFNPGKSLTSVNNNSNSVYNYGISVNVSNSNASTDDIARAVITQIKNIDGQRIRGQK
jgi:TP901 family phage tail tape measure protein